MCVQGKMRGSSVVSDRSSDTSESTTLNSHEEEKEFDPEYVEERFRVDRKKLEQMIRGDCEKTEAEVFFEQVMEITQTQISWPSKLKIGAKSKKDPHIKISGKGNLVKEAKQLVMAKLDTKKNKVKLKMDVPFTDHSHIIGKDGSNIQQVVSETGCHIHFPDSNRNNPVEKSNQVSIDGIPQQAERARALIRSLLPLSFSFEVPIAGFLQPYPDSCDSTIQQLQSLYNVTIRFRQRVRSYICVVVVRGNENQANNVKEATKKLMEHFGHAAGVQLPVTLTMEIAPQHHSLVAGRMNANVNIISQVTGTQMVFPESETAAFQPRKGTVIITGSVDGVHSARQKLIGCLPLVLMFDLKEDEPDASFVNEIAERFDVMISVKPKLRQSVKSVIIRGMERNVNELFEARRALLGVELSEPSVTCMVPPTYTIGGHSTIFRNSPDFGVLSLGIVTNGCNPVPPVVNSAYGSIAPPLLPARWDTTERRVYNPFVVPQVTNIRSYKNYSEQAQSLSSNTTSALSSPLPSPRKLTSSGIGTTETKDSVDLTSNSSLARLQELLKGEPQTFDKVSEQKDMKIGSHLADYERKRMLADKVMKEKPSLANTRIPNSFWSGCGFSKSMPEAKLNQKNRLLRMSGVEGVLDEEDENVENQQGNKINGSPCNCVNDSELGQVLKRIGFEKYTYLFQEQEIDMSTFLNLSEKDLTELGIPTMGARKKIFDTIKELNQQSFSAAPGAERRSFAASGGSVNGFNAPTLSKW